MFDPSQPHRPAYVLLSATLSALGAAGCDASSDGVDGPSAPSASSGPVAIAPRCAKCDGTDGVPWFAVTNFNNVEAPAWMPADSWIKTTGSGAATWSFRGLPSTDGASLSNVRVTLRGHVVDLIAPPPSGRTAPSIGIPTDESPTPPPAGATVTYAVKKTLPGGSHLAVGHDFQLPDVLGARSEEKLGAFDEDDFPDAYSQCVFDQVFPSHGNWERLSAANAIYDAYRVLAMVGPVDAQARPSQGCSLWWFASLTGFQEEFHRLLADYNAWLEPTPGMTFEMQAEQDAAAERLYEHARVSMTSTRDSLLAALEYIGTSGATGACAKKKERANSILGQPGFARPSANFEYAMRLTLKLYDAAIGTLDAWKSGWTASTVDAHEFDGTKSIDDYFGTTVAVLAADAPLRTASTPADWRAIDWAPTCEGHRIGDLASRIADGANPMFDYLAPPSFESAVAAGLIQLPADVEAWLRAHPATSGDSTVPGTCATPAQLAAWCTGSTCPVSTVGAPSTRTGHSTIWTCDEVIIWGGWQGTGVNNSDPFLDDGARYNPRTNTWTPLPSDGAPTARYGHSAVWTGTDMIVWAGVGAGGNPLQSGRRYNLATNRWLPYSVTTVDAPSARWSHSAVWTGSQMIVWGGGESADDELGGVYNPLTNAWSVFAPGAAGTGITPALRTDHGAAWTGTEMFLWGGWVDSKASKTGERYNPETGKWRSVSKTKAPPAIASPLVVWTGTEVLVWGRASTGVMSGGWYNPTTNKWRALATTPPQTYAGATAAWLGGEAFIWGGEGDGSFWHEYADGGWIWRP